MAEPSQEEPKCSDLKQIAEQRHRCKHHKYRIQNSVKKL